MARAKTPVRRVARAKSADGRGRSALTSNTLLKLGAELASSAQAVHAGVSVAVVPPVALDGREVGRTPRLITVLWRLLSGAWLFLDVRLHYLTNNYYFPITNLIKSSNNHKIHGEVIIELIFISISSSLLVVVIESSCHVCLAFCRKDVLAGGLKGLRHWLGCTGDEVPDRVRQFQFDLRRHLLRELLLERLPVYFGQLLGSLGRIRPQNLLGTTLLLLVQQAIGKELVLAVGLLYVVGYGQ